MICAAILGAGIGVQHLEAYRALSDRFQVSLIVDRDAARARAMDASIEWSGEIEVAISDPEIDLIDICLPPHLHVPVALDALAAGKHVICEKPIATSMADIARLRVASEATGAQLFPIFQYRFGPAIAALKTMISNGLTGAPQVAALETHWSRDAAYYSEPWRGTWVGEQGGAILGHAIHAHDLLTYLIGPVAQLSAAIATRVNPIETEDCAAISFQMANGALATSSVTLGAAVDETRIRLVFENLTATSGCVPYAPATGTWRFEARDPALQPKLDAIVQATARARAGYVGAFDAIADALQGTPGHEVTFADGAASIELVTAIYASARTGVRTTLPLSKDHALFNGWLPDQTV